MVKRRKKGITKKGTGKGFNERPQEARKIGASTIYDWLAPVPPVHATRNAISPATAFAEHQPILIVENRGQPLT